MLFLMWGGLANIHVYSYTVLYTVHHNLVIAKPTAIDLGELPECQKMYVLLLITYSSLCRVYNAYEKILEQWHDHNGYTTVRQWVWGKCETWGLAVIPEMFSGVYH